MTDHDRVSLAELVGWCAIVMILMTPVRPDRSIWHALADSARTATRWSQRTTRILATLRDWSYGQAQDWEDRRTVTVRVLSEEP